MNSLVIWHFVMSFLCRKIDKAILNEHHPTEDWIRIRICIVMLCMSIFCRFIFWNFLRLISSKLRAGNVIWSSIIISARISLKPSLIFRFFYVIKVKNNVHYLLWIYLTIYQRKMEKENLWTIKRLCETSKHTIRGRKKLRVPFYFKTTRIVLQFFNRNVR